MVKLFALVFMSVVALATSEYPTDRTVFYPTRACQNDHFEHWRKLVQKGEAMRADNVEMRLDLSQLDKQQLLYHIMKMGTNDFIFDLFTKAGDEESEDLLCSSEGFKNDLKAILLGKQERGEDAVITLEEIEEAFTRRDREELSSGEEKELAGEIEGDYFVGKSFKDLSKRDRRNALKRLKKEQVESRQRLEYGGPFSGGYVNDEISSGSVLPLLPDKRPKLHVTGSEGDKTEYVLKMIRIQLPTEVYNPDNLSPVHVMVYLFFLEKRLDDKGKELMIQFPIYGNVEDGITSDELLEKFLADLAADKDAKKHGISRDLTMVKTALEAVTEGTTGLYFDKEGFVALAPCRYVKNDVLRDLFRQHHVDEDQETEVLLPIDDYNKNPQLAKKRDSCE